MNGGMVVGMIGLALIAGAGTAYIAVNEMRPQKVEIVRVPVVPPPPTPAFGPVPHVTVNSVSAPTPAAAPEPAPAVIEKVVEPKAPVKKRKKVSAAKKLKTKWAAPKERPFSLGDLFNVGR
jgi:hypothetical protein